MPVYFTKHNSQWRNWGKQFKLAFLHVTMVTLRREVGKIANGA